MRKPRQVQHDRELTPYQQKLLDPRWQKRRLEILQRDGWACQQCQEKEKTLHVHHQWYEHGKNPWEYPDEVLVTLCKDCHQEETNERPYAEQLLLNILRWRRLSHEGVLELALAFEHWQLVGSKDSPQQHLVNTNLDALLWPMNNEEVMQMIYEKYYE